MLLHIMWMIVVLWGCGKLRDGMQSIALALDSDNEVDE